MKKLVFMLSALLMASVNFAQSNNPQNKVGADIVAAANALYKEYKEGKLKDLNQATIDYYYKSLLPDYQPIKVEDANRIVKALKDGNNESVIKNSGFSNLAQDFLRKSLTDYSTTKLVDEVNRSSLNEVEKTNVLTVLAINYNVIPLFAKDREAKSPAAKGPNAFFDLAFDDALITQSDGIQSLIWGGLGALTGFKFCGIYCSIAGAIFGLIYGSLPGTTTTVSSSSGGSQTYSNGYPQP